MRAQTQEEYLRAIRETNPEPPSKRINRMDDEMRIQIAKFRGSDPAALEKSLTSELDRIVIKCLEKDRDRRYESTSSLASDIRRYVNEAESQKEPDLSGGSKMPRKLLLEVTKIIVEPFWFSVLIRSESEWYKALAIILTSIIFCVGFCAFLFLSDHQAWGITFGVCFAILFLLAVIQKKSKK